MKVYRPGLALGCIMSGRKVKPFTWFTLGSCLVVTHIHTSSFGQVGHLCVTLMPYAEHRSLSVDAEDTSSLTISVHTPSFDLQGVVRYRADVTYTSVVVTTTFSTSDKSWTRGTGYPHTLRQNQTILQPLISGGCGTRLTVVWLALVKMDIREPTSLHPALA